MIKDSWKPHPGPQTEFMSRKEDVVLYQGGKGSGKSDSILIEALRQTENKNYKALIVRRTFPRIQELIDRAHNIYPRVGGKWQGELHRFTFPSGSYIRFGHCNSEMDKQDYQGHEYALICFDQLEEFTESQVNFIMAQNRCSDPSVKCYVRATANPGGVGHWSIKRRFIDNKEPGKTYSDTYELPNGMKITRTFCHIFATIHDNPTLVEAQPTYLANLMSLPEAERKAYLSGDWNAFTSECVFDAHGLQLQEKKIEAPKWVGFLRETQESFQIIPDTTGNLKVWEEPFDGEPYEIGVDVAEGDKTGDYSSVHVVNKRNWRVVAVWHGHRNPLELANIVDSLGRYYNTAEVAVEVPGPGVATVGKLVELGYPQLYRYDTDKYGWRTDMSTRNHLIATLLDSVRGSHVTIRDRETLDECYNLIRNPRTMKIEAREGTYDDRMMSLGITLQCIRVNPYFEPRRKDALGLRRMSSIITQKPVGHRVKATGY
jgi:hypothetical protein